jgi:hypothetical protein
MAVSLLLLAFTAACTQAPPPDTRDADVQGVRDIEKVQLRKARARRMNPCALDTHGAMVALATPKTP